MSKSFLILLFLISCAHTVTYRFTCPDKETIVRLKVRSYELDDQSKLYDRVVKVCNE